MIGAAWIRCRAITLRHKDHEGRSTLAIDAARKTAAKVPHHRAGALAWTADFPVTPLLAYVRFGRWQEILTEPKSPAQEPYAIGIWHYARALAFVARDRKDRARQELSELAGGDARLRPSPRR